MQHSQLAPLPNDLPFRIVSKTIGQGAYAWYVNHSLKIPLSNTKKGKRKF